MGHLKINFTSEGKNVAEPPLIHGKVAKLQLLQRKYWTNRIEQIDVEGEDYVLSFDIDSIEGEVDWVNATYPNEEVKGKVLELIYYKEQFDKLEKVTSEIAQCTYNDRYKLSSLGKEAIRIIESTSESKYFPDFKFEKEDAIESISHTLNKEVDMLQSYTKPNDSERRKIDALYEATSHLSNDIHGFQMHLEHFDVNSAVK